MKPNILDMLAYRRPAGSVTEAIFIENYIAPLPGAYQDVFGNWIVVTDPTSTVLFSCHTDTVHHEPGMQTLHVRDGVVYLSNKAKRKHSNCLGADDTAGCWILIHLILAKVPGTYVFHYGEERGCIGSSALARSCEPWLKQFTHAIAFDRRGTRDVVTHQMGQRCASDVFALSFAALLEQAGLSHYTPAEGVYTDTASYMDVIPECTNISVGYYSEHSTAECLNIDHLAHLRDALIRLDWSALVVDRDPSEPDPFDWRGGFYTSRRYEDPLADRDCGPDDVTVLCMTCGNTFDFAEQTCPDCGETDPDRLDVIDNRPTGETDADIDREIYLNDAYAEVQAELARQMARYKRDRGNQ